MSKSFILKENYDQRADYVSTQRILCYTTNKELCNLFSNLDSGIPVMLIIEFNKLQGELLS